MSDLNDLAIFILTYGRASEQVTLKELIKKHVKKNVYLVVSDDDEQLEQYQEKYGKQVLVFSRDSVQEQMMDNQYPKTGIISARNMCRTLAKKLGYKYFLELDDDYVGFNFRYVKDGKLKTMAIKDLRPLFLASIELLDRTPIEAFAWAQAGDFIGGADSQTIKLRWKRKAMNVIFMRSDTDYQFIGRINEDVNAYINAGKTGQIVLTESYTAIVQAKTQKTENGMTDLYKHGTYKKSMYSVIQDPAIVRLRMMGNKFMRIHHEINWNACCPKIINEKYKK